MVPSEDPTAREGDGEEEAMPLPSDPKTFYLAGLFLLAPVSDTSRPKGYTPFRFGTNDVALSPVNQIDGKMPPTLLMHADTDEVVPYRERLTSDFDWQTVAGQTAQVYLASKRRERQPQPRLPIVEHALPNR